LAPLQLDQDERVTGKQQRVLITLRPRLMVSALLIPSCGA